MIETLMICKADMTHYNAHVRCYLKLLLGWIKRETIFTATKCY